MQIFFIVSEALTQCRSLNQCFDLILRPDWRNICIPEEFKLVVIREKSRLELNKKKKTKQHARPPLFFMRHDKYRLTASVS